MEWQDISTAPKDGTHIIVFNGDGDKRFYTEPNAIGIVKWDNNGFTLSSGENAIYGWMAVDCCDGVTQYDPTHWMPLPPPPTDAMMKQRDEQG